MVLRQIRLEVDVATKMGEEQLSKDPGFSTKRPAPPGVHRGKQRPTTFARPLDTRGTYLARYIERTRTQPSPLNTTQTSKSSVSAPGAPRRAVRRHLGRRRRRCVNVPVNFPEHKDTPRPQIFLVPVQGPPGRLIKTTRDQSMWTR
jgi:hypothetical protein